MILLLQLLGRRLTRIAVILAGVLLIAAMPWLPALAGGADERTAYARAAPESYGYLHRSAGAPELSIEPYVRPELEARMLKLRPALLAIAARHNQPAWSGLSDAEFAVVLATVLYNEHNGWFEDDLEPVRALTPLYQGLQQRLNGSGLGSNFSVWPSNMRPSVALEILRHQLPVPGPTQFITVPVRVASSRVVPERYASEQALYAAITAELSDDTIAIEYLAANLERGIYRARYEGVKVSWRTLAAWHNQGLVDPLQIRANPTASDYVRRASAYLPTARRLIIGARAAYERIPA